MSAGQSFGTLSGIALAVALLGGCSGVFYSGAYSSSAPDVPLPVERRPVILVEKAECPPKIAPRMLRAEWFELYDVILRGRLCQAHLIGELNRSGMVFAIGLPDDDGQLDYESALFQREGVLPDAKVRIAVVEYANPSGVGGALLFLPGLLTLGIIPFPGPGSIAKFEVTADSGRSVSPEYRLREWIGPIPAIASPSLTEESAYAQNRSRQLAKMVLDALMVPSARPRPKVVDEYLAHVARLRAILSSAEYREASHNPVGFSAKGYCFLPTLSYLRLLARREQWNAAQLELETLKLAKSCTLYDYRALAHAKEQATFLDSWAGPVSASVPAPAP